MRKKISILLVIMMSFTMLVLTGCNNTKDNTNDSSNMDDTSNPSAPSIESALAFYTEVWAAFSEDNKFS